jgi:hypothetical protein
LYYSQPDLNLLSIYSLYSCTYFMINLLLQIEGARLVLVWWVELSWSMVWYLVRELVVWCRNRACHWWRWCW